MACFLAATLDSILDYFPSMTEGLLVDSVLRCTFIYLDPFYLKDLLRWISLFIRLILLRSFSALIIIYAMLPPLMWRLFLRPTWINRLFFCLSNKHFVRKLTASWIVDASRFELWPLSMYSSCLYLEPAYLQSSTTSSLLTNSSIDEVINSSGVSIFPTHFRGQSCLISKQQYSLIFVLIQSNRCSMMNPGIILRSAPNFLTNSQSEAQGESRMHPAIQSRYLAWLRQKITQNKQESTCGCPHRPPPQQYRTIAQLAHSFDYHVQIMRLVVAQTDELTL